LPQALPTSAIAEDRVIEGDAQILADIDDPALAAFDVTRLR